MEDEKKAVIDKLEHYNSKFNFLLCVLAAAEGRWMNGAESAIAWDKLGHLNESLDSDLDELNHRRDEWNHFERACLAPALRKSQSHVRRIRKGWPPSGGKWLPVLREAQHDITFMLNGLIKDE